MKSYVAIMKWLGIYISGGSYGRCHRLVTSGGRKEGFWFGALEAELGCAGVFFRSFFGESLLSR